MKSLRPIAPLALVTLAGFACLNACSSNQSSSTPAPTVLRGIHLVSVKNQQIPDHVSAVGSVHSVESSVLAAQVMGTVLKVSASQGDHVRTGDTLITIDAASLRADVDRASAAVAAANSQNAVAGSEAHMAAATLKRYQDLKEKKSVSPQEFEEVETRSHVASARLEMVRSQLNEAKAQESAANTMLGYTRLRAPFDGIVTERKVDPGSLATPGTPLLIVEKSGKLRLEISVDESLLPTIRIGESIPVIIDAIATTSLTGKVAEIVPAADPGSHSFMVKIDLPLTQGLRSGMFGKAQLTRDSKTAILVPRSAVVTHGSLQGVYVVDVNHIANLRYITLGDTPGEQVDVLSGLSAGETIIDTPADQEFAGKQIEAQQ